MDAGDGFSSVGRRPEGRKGRIREELADILLYLNRLADKIEIGLLAAASDKIRVNAKKYTVEKARGSSKNYTEL